VCPEDHFEDATKREKGVLTHVKKYSIFGTINSGWCEKGIEMDQEQNQLCLFQAPSVEQLPLGHYRVRVERGSLPSLGMLEKIFSVGGVSTLFDEGCKWKPHHTCRLTRKSESGETIFYVHDFSRDIVYNEVIRWAVANGYLPANEWEMLSLGADPQTRDLAKQGPLLGLGSYTMSSGIRCVPALYMVSHKRFFHAWMNRGWPRSSRFVFVRTAL
jgi:hypothetical protein